VRFSQSIHRRANKTFSVSVTTLLLITSVVIGGFSLGFLYYAASQFIYIILLSPIALAMLGIV
jgi:hypothetical protein